MGFYSFNVPGMRGLRGGSLSSSPIAPIPPPFLPPIPLPFLLLLLLLLPRKSLFPPIGLFIPLPPFNALFIPLPLPPLPPSNPFLLDVLPDLWLILFSRINSIRWVSINDFRADRPQTIRLENSFKAPPGSDLNIWLSRLTAFGIGSNRTKVPCKRKEE